MAALGQALANRRLITRWREPWAGKPTMAARWRWHSWHVAQLTSSRCVAGQITTGRPAGVVVLAVVVDGKTTTTGPAA